MNHQKFQKRYNKISTTHTTSNREKKCFLGCSHLFYFKILITVEKSRLADLEDACKHCILDAHMLQHAVMRIT